MYKKIVSFFLMLAITISCNAFIADAAAAKNVKVSVKLQSIDCISNNHVGNEWAFGCTVNKKDLSEGKSIVVTTTPSGKISIVSTAEEEDSIPDVGSKTLSVSVSKLKAGKEATYTSRVTVRENRGRYSGNTAVWEFTYIIKRT